MKSQTSPNVVIGSLDSGPFFLYVCKVKKLFLISSIIITLLSCSASSVAKFERVNNFQDWSEEEKEVYFLLYSSIPLPDMDIHEAASIRCNMLLDEGTEITHGGYPFISEYLRQLGFSNVSEILAYGFSTPESTVKAWLNSENHRKIIEGKHKYLGISVIDKYYVIIYCD